MINIIFSNKEVVSSTPSIDVSFLILIVIGAK